MFVETRQLLLVFARNCLSFLYWHRRRRGWLYMDWMGDARVVDKAIVEWACDAAASSREIRAGESLIFWRVEEGEKNSFLRLKRK